MLHFDDVIFRVSEKEYNYIAVNDVLVFACLCGEELYIAYPAKCWDIKDAD